MKKVIKYIFLVLVTAVFNCVEELDVVTIVEAGYEDTLVVEATITDEMKTQVILLSRAYRLEDVGPLPETDAQIQIVGDNGNVYQFQETESGKYESISSFAAQDGVEYNLEIRTSDNQEYESSKSMLSGKSKIDDLYLERNFNENNTEGISIYVDGSDPTGRAEFYRYTYEETYKIIAPKYSSFDLDYEFIYDPPIENIYDNIPRELIGITYFLIPKEEQEQICYNTVYSNEIILNATAGLDIETVEKYRVLFLNRLNTIITHRYSILVSQYVQSAEAYIYYKTLNDLSNQENLLSQSQSGFINGNLFSTSNSNLKVIGFFDVSSVEKRRIYFNYSDLFPGESLPPYFQSCTPFAPLESKPGPTFPLADAIDQGNKYFEPNEDIMANEGSYDMVSRICGDCTVIGNNYPPDFWIE